jgi:hypothetical protein
MTLLLLFAGSSGILITDNITISESVTVSGPTAIPDTGIHGGYTRLGLQVFEDSTEAVVIADWTARAQNVIAETGPHGYATLSANVPMTTVEAFRFYDNTAAAHVVLGDGAFRVFEGRIEDGLWSESNYRGWRVATAGDGSPSPLTKRNPEKFHTDSDNRLYITLRKNEIYGDVGTAGGDTCEWYYETSHNSDRDIAFLTFDYEVSLPTDWELRVNSYVWGFGSGVTEATVVTGPSTASSSHSETITASKQVVGIQLVFDEVADGTYTNSGETDDYFVSITNVRVLTGASSTEVYADEIAKGLISHTNTVNSTQINASTALVESPGVDLNESEYLDEYPGDILNDLVGIGDDQTPPNYYEWGVWENQQLHFRQRGSVAQEWYIDLGEFSIDSTIDTMRNSAYGLYTNKANKAKRTDVGDDSASQSKYGVIRRGHTRASDTTINSVTETYRDALLEDLKDITPRAQIVVDKIFTSSGAVAPVWLARAGDNVTIRNLPPTGGSLDKIRHFRIHRTRLDCDTGILTIIPELEPPSLVDMVAASAKVTGV